ncbi:DNA mismatch repair protein MutS [Xanthomarina sp. F1114]|uniref:Smr/MutS family protein n=1 Tax=Xanthomarina sp. F1114 TaxID=2996019 RepID=UPI00225E0EA8|nr:Smr/MutS family protein [Xanthomarina sp. F1114]MCX7547673.1 DNA mismatch repair protein MutS [Xanthomarina sp. F1114]
MFNKGDKVSVLDEDLTGFVVKVVGDIITIEDANGFEMDFNKRELVLINNEADLKSKSFLNTSFNEVLKEKEVPKKKTSVKKKAKERYQPTMEVDLHIHQLTDKTQMSNHDMLTLQLDTARRQLDFAIRKRIQKVVFIHGVGQGVLKTELEYLFGRYNNVKYYDANFQKYGLGATEVYIFQNVNPD